ncbi:hypothetical protein JCM17961_15920 [Endothiovibrio diazotrophicus]
MSFGLSSSDLTEKADDTNKPSSTLFSNEGFDLHWLRDFDGFEPNDALIYASPLQSGTVAGYIETSNDVDYYVLTVPRTGSLNLSLVNEASGQYRELRLYNSNQSSLRSINVSGVSAGQIDYTVTPGIYYLRVSGNGYSSQPYRLTVAGAVFDSSELDTHEPNEAFGSAVSIEEGNTTGYIETSNDIDFYTLEVSSVGSINLTLTNETSGQYRELRLYNANQSSLRSVNVSGVSSGQIDYTLTPGTYYLRVSGNGYSEQPYRLTVAGAVFGAAGQDAHEPNEAFGTAVAIEAGSTTGYIETGNDIDFYKLEVAVVGSLNLSLTNEASGQYRELRLYNANQSSLRSVNVNGVSSDQIDYTVTPGTYYLRVSGNGYSSQPYRLTVGGMVFGSSDFDIHEPNEAFGTAVAIGAGSTTGYIETSNDIDFYSLEVFNVGGLNVALANETSGQYRELRLYNANQSSLRSVNVSGVSSGQIDYTVTPGTYYLRVSGSGYSSQPYRLSLTGSVFDSANAMPSAVIGATPHAGQAPLTVSLSGASSSDPGGFISSYSWVSSNGLSGSGETASMTFTVAGSYTVTLSVTDNDGNTDTATETIIVDAAPEPVAPVAVIRASATSGSAPLTVTLDGSGSSDADGFIASYTWSSSDGQSYAGRTASMTFEREGTFTVVLSVEDDDGMTASATETVVVSGGGYVPNGGVGTEVDGVTRLVVGGRNQAVGNLVLTEPVARSFSSGGSFRVVLPSHVTWVSGQINVNTQVTGGNGAPVTATGWSGSKATTFSLNDTLVITFPRVNGDEGASEVTITLPLVDVSAAISIGAVSAVVVDGDLSGANGAGLIGGALTLAQVENDVIAYTPGGGVTGDVAGVTNLVVGGANQALGKLVLTEPAARSFFPGGSMRLVLRSGVTWASAQADVDTRAISGTGAPVSSSGWGIDRVTTFSSNDTLVITLPDLTGREAASEVTITLPPVNVSGSRWEGSVSVDLVDGDAAAGNPAGVTGRVLTLAMIGGGAEGPSAAFTLLAAGGEAPLVVNVDASGSEPRSDIIAYTWATSDGQSAVGSTASFTFDRAGRYTITLSVIDSSGEVATTEETVSVTVGEEDGDTMNVTYNDTARLGPQVIAAGVSPSQIDLADDKFDIVALVRPGILPIQSVSFRSTNGGFAMAMNRAGVLSNSDEVYKTTFAFQRGSFGTTTLSTAWGEDEGQFNVEVVDQGAQHSHAFPALRWGNYPEQTAAGQEVQPVNYNATRRLAPQVVMGGYSPALLDVADSAFDVIAVIRDGVLPVEQVTLSQNAGEFSQLMNEAGVLDNGDKVYKMTFTYLRGSFQPGTVMKALWGDQPGQFYIQAVDHGQQHTHAFPDIEFGSYPAQ